MAIKKYLQLGVTSLYLVGAGYDTNGNKVVKVTIGSNRAFAIQTAACITSIIHQNAA